MAIGFDIRSSLTGDLCPQCHNASLRQQGLALAAPVMTIIPAAVDKEAKPMATKYRYPSHDTVFKTALGAAVALAVGRIRMAV